MSTSSLGKWVDEAFDKIFFQPNDEIALKAFEDHISPNMQVRINGNALTSEMFKKAVFDARTKEEFSILTIQELLSKNGDAEVGVDGSVSQISTFAVKDKQTGATREETSQTIITVAWNDGKRIITDMTEITV